MKKRAQLLDHLASLVVISLNEDAFNPEGFEKTNLYRKEKGLPPRTSEEYDTDLYSNYVKMLADAKKDIQEYTLGREKTLENLRIAQDKEKELNRRIKYYNSNSQYDNATEASVLLDYLTENVDTYLDLLTLYNNMIQKKQETIKEVSQLIKELEDYLTR